MTRFEITTRVPEVCRAEARSATEQVLAARLLRAATAAGMTVLEKPACRWDADPDAFSHDGPTFSWLVTVSAPVEAKKAAA